MPSALHGRIYNTFYTCLERWGRIKNILLQVYIFIQFLYKHDTILLNRALFFSLSCFMYSVLQLDSQEPHSFMSSMEFSVGKDDKALGIAALNECPVILCLSSVKSTNNFARTSLIFFLVRFLPDGKEKTGLFPTKSPFFSFNFFNKNIADAGHILSPLILNTSTILLLKPVVFV